MKDNITFIKPILFFLFIASTAYSQNNTQERLGLKASPILFKRVMEIKNPTVEQFDTLWELTILYCRISGDTCLILSEHAAAITNESENILLKGRGLLSKGKAHVKDSTGLELLMSARDILDEAGDASFQSMAEAALGDYYINRDNLKKALEHNLEALRLGRLESDTMRILSPLMAVGGVYYNMGNFEKALEYIGQVAQLMEAVGDKSQLPPLLTNKAHVLKRLGDQFIAIADTMTVGAEIYRDSAEYCFRKGLAETERALILSKEMNNGMGQLASLTSIANFHVSMGEFTEAIIVGKKALVQGEKMQITHFIVESHNVLANAYKSTGQLEKALFHAEKGYQISKQQKTAKSPYYFEAELYAIYKKMGRTEDALNMLEKMKKHADELHRTETKKAIADAETKYQTAEKEKEILKQQNDILELENKNGEIAKQRNYIMGGAIMVSFFGFFGYRINKIQKDRNDKKAFAEALIYAQEEERKRIARDLHDGVGQSLLLMKKQLTENVEVTLENQRMISDTLEEVRSISRDLHPFQLDKFGLTATISDMVYKVEKSTELFVSKEIGNIDNVLPPKSEIHLFRTIQESLSNIVKHARATAAKVSVNNNPDTVNVLIQDNGKGFDLEMTVVASKSLGIKTMHERISAIGGELKIKNGENGGTKIEINIPKK